MLVTLVLHEELVSALSWLPAVCVFQWVLSLFSALMGREERREGIRTLFPAWHRCGIVEACSGWRYDR